MEQEKKNSEAVENIAIEGSPRQGDEDIIEAEYTASASEQMDSEQIDDGVAVDSTISDMIEPDSTTTGALAMKSTIGEIMIEADGLAYADTTVAGCIDYLVRRQALSQLTYIYVIDDDRVLCGVVVLRDLLLAKPGQTLGEIMCTELQTFSPDTLLGKAVQTALSTHHRLYPVTDEDGRMVGMVYGWQLFERVATELSVQAGSTVGLDREERLSTPTLQAFRMRHPWLQVNLLTAFAAAFVVGIFEDTIAQIIVLAVFLPVLAGQSGNTGCQALAITLRGITLRELENFPVRKLFMKELVLGGMNGVGVGVIAAVAMFFYASMNGTDNPAILALVILLAMIGACMASGVLGVAVPLILRRFGADPAMASSIFLTTFTDIVGMGLMLTLATTLLL